MNDIAHIGQSFVHINGDEYEVMEITPHAITLMELSGVLWEVDPDEFRDLLSKGTLEPMTDEEELEDIDMDNDD
jgi:hypothetical protein